MAKPVTLCPDCYMFDGTDTSLLPSRPGSQAKCEKGHTWDDMEDLQQRLTLAKNKRAAIEAQNNPQKEESEEDKKKKIEAMQKPKGNEIVICMDDYKRLSDMLGHFPDGSTLYGKVYAMMEEIKGMQQQIDELNKKKPAGGGNGTMMAGAPPSGGEIQMTINIPERHVMSLFGIAEAQRTSAQAYVQAIVESGFDNGWFF